MNSKFFSSKLLSGIFLLAFVSLIGFTSCSDDDPIPVTLGEYDTKTLEMVVGEQEDISIGGNGGYLASLDKEGVVTVSVDKEDRLLIKAVGAGTAKVTITDQENKTGSVTVKVINKLTVDKESVSVYLGGSATVNILTGNGGYTLEGINKEVAEASLEGNIITINAVALGNTSVTLKEESGATIDIKIQVLEETALVGTKWLDGELKPEVVTDYEPATTAILNNINNNEQAASIKLATFLFQEDNKFVLYALTPGLFLLKGDYSIIDENIVLTNIVPGPFGKELAKHIKGDVAIAINGDLATMTEFNLPMNQTETFDAAKLQEIADEVGDPKIADAKIEKVIVNINLKKKQ